MNGLPCFDRTDQQTGTKLVILVDSGATNNYVSQKNITHGKLIKLRNSVFVKTILGTTEITHFVKINLFGHDLRFYVVNYLGNFDLIFGMDGLRKINANIDLMSFKLTYSSLIQNQMFNHIVEQNVNEEIKTRIDQLIEKNTDTHFTI